MRAQYVLRRAVLCMGKEGKTERRENGYQHGWIRKNAKEGIVVELKKLIYTVEDGIAIITMNYLKNLNAIDEVMAAELEWVFGEAEKDPNVKVIVFKGSEKAFSAGGDIGFFYKLFSGGGAAELDPLIAQVARVTNGMKKMGKLIICEVSGAAAGAGASLAISGDFMICADNAMFMLAFVNIGLVPDTGGTYLLSKSIGATRAMELSATGRPVKADELQALGLAYKVVPKEELHDTVMKFAKKLAAGPLVSYKGIKKQIYEANFADYARFLAEGEGPAQHDASLTEDFKEGVRAFIEKRKANFQGK